MWCIVTFGPKCMSAFVKYKSAFRWTYICIYTDWICPSIHLSDVTTELSFETSPAGTETKTAAAQIERRNPLEASVQINDRGLQVHGPGGPGKVCQSERVQASLEGVSVGRRLAVVASVCAAGQSAIGCWPIIPGSSRWRCLLPAAELSFVFWLLQANPERVMEVCTASTAEYIVVELIMIMYC